MGCCESNNPKATVNPNLNNNTQTQTYSTQVQTYNTNQVTQNGFNQKIISDGNFTITQFQGTTFQTGGMNVFDDDDDDSFMKNCLEQREKQKNDLADMIQNWQKITNTKRNQNKKNIEDLIILDENYDYTEFQKRSLERHNYYRRMHHVCDLQLSNELCEEAQNYAEYLAANNKTGHSYHKFKGEEMGENLYYTTAKPDANAAVDAWYEEIEDYDFGNGKSKNGNKVGHLTQVLWKESKYLGVGLAYNNGTYYVAANYFPSGNFRGHYTENVFPK